MKDDRENIDDIFFQNLDEYRVEPSAMLKKRINRKMFFVNILHYHLIKALLLVVAVGIAVAIAFYVFNNDKPTQNTKPTKVHKIEKTTTTDLNPENKKIETEKNNQTALSDKMMQKDNVAKTQNINNTNGKIKAVLSKTLKSKDSNKQEDAITPNYYVTKQAIEGTDLITPINNIVSILPIDSIKKEQSSQIKQEENLSQSKDSLLNVKISDSNKVANDSSATKIKQSKNKVSLEYSSDILVGLNYNHTIFSSDVATYQPFIDEKNSGLQNYSGSLSYGANFNIKYKNLILQTGLAFTNLKSESEYGQIIKNIRNFDEITENGFYYNYIENGTTQLFDTSYKIIQMIDSSQMDSLGNYKLIDVTVPIIDTIFIPKYDTVAVTKYDTVHKTLADTINKRTFATTLKYIEVPIIVGYQISLKKFDFAVKGGAIVSYLYKVTGQSYTLDSKYDLVNVTEYIPYKKYNLSALISLNVNYNINSRFGIWIEPMYRRNIFSLINNDFYMSQKSTVLGIKTGIRIKF